MDTVAVIGEPHRSLPFGLAGAIVFEALNPEAAVAAWRALPNDVRVVLLSPAAAAAIGAAGSSGATGASGSAADRLVVTLP
jgi:vacuolar-type H+-ATPase subunit F/Vma7